MSACCVVGCQFVGKITSRQPIVSCWLCENIAHAKCADFGHGAAQMPKSNANLDWTCPTCLHIKIDIRAFMRQTELEFQALRAGFTDLLNINHRPTLPNVSLHVPDLSINLSLPSPTAGYVSCDEDDPNGTELSTNDATGQSLPDSGTVVSPESLRPTNRSPAVATSGALPIKNTLAPPPVPLTSMEKHA